MGDLSVQEQVLLAHESERIAAKRRWYQISEWGVMNALASSFSLSNGLASNKGMGGANAAPLVPFGSTTNNIDNSRVGLSPAGLLGLVGLAGLGGVGAASMAGVFDTPAPPPPPPVVETVVKEKALDVFIDWEMVPNDAPGTGISNDE